MRGERTVMKNSRSTVLTRSGMRALLGLLVLFTATSCALLHGSKGPPPAKLKISGLGWLGDWDRRHSLEQLLGQERGETLDANAVEDAMFLLMSAVQEEGFLKPSIEVEITDEQGRKVNFT